MDNVIFPVLNFGLSYIKCRSLHHHIEKVDLILYDLVLGIALANELMSSIAMIWER